VGEKVNAYRVSYGKPDGKPMPKLAGDQSKFYE
jgi:hypothetical protein